MEELQTGRPLPEDCVFALDIGTRSVIGIVGRQKEQLFEVLAVEIMEHPQRAMTDGQIEDIRQVAKVAEQVKGALEKRLGFVLSRVNVAAAGRALKSDRAEYEMLLSPEPVTPRQVYDLEMGAINSIREKVSVQSEENVGYYCVGHSVVHYYLDNYPFSTIVGHKGTVARADVIATFLPAAVVDSLCAAMAMIGCEIAHLTLEPIAAMNAVIPTELRLLNLALVDIGAGTSDIAISENGTVAAYTMATTAGDEITEELIKKYLVDFQTAERMKHEASAGQEQVSYQDILGFEYHLSLEEVLATLKPAVDALGNVICEKILEANTKPPAAVFLVGGGSLVPLLCESVADGLALERNKVAVGGNNFIRRVATGNEEMIGPEFATPLGIALTAVMEGAQHGFYLFVNGKKTRLFRNDHVTVMDALLLCGFHYHQLMGHNGHSITYLLNGEKQILRGGHLVSAVIHVNGVEANLTEPLNNEDHVDVIPAQDGQDACLTLSMLDADPFASVVYLNETPLHFGREVTINGEPAQPGQEIFDHDVVVTHEIITLGQLSAQLGVAGELLLLNGAHCGMDMLLQEGDHLEAITPVRRDSEVLRANALPKEEVPALPLEPDSVPMCAEPELVVEASAQQTAARQPFAVPEPTQSMVQQPSVPSDSVPSMSTTQQVSLPDGHMPKQTLWQQKLEQAWTEPAVSAVPVAPIVSSIPAEHKKSWADMVDEAWNAPTLEPAPAPVPTLAEAPPTNETAVSWGVRSGIKITLNDDSTWLEPKAQGGYQFLDMLNLVDIDPTKPQGNIILKLNGRQASYLDDIRNGDVVEIYWESV